MLKTILITGAGTGIGKDAAKKLLARGHTVYATTYSEAEISALQTELGPAARIFKLDITRAEDRAKIADLDLDVLINNAAQNLSGSLAEVNIDRVRGLFEVNLFSSLELTQIAIRSMIARRGGTIIFMSSITGRVPEPFVMPYSMTKFAISAAAAGLRAEMKVLGKGIHVSVVEPGPYRTGFNQKLVGSQFETIEREGSLFSPTQIEAHKKATDSRLQRLAMIASNSRASLTPEIEKSGINANASRVKSSTTHRIRKRRPPDRLSETKSKLHRSFGLVGRTMGRRDPRARLRPFRRRTASFSSA
ncbi:DltE Short-chain dehydrogenases of various substrate specificities [Caulobacteraceae bacterium]